VSRDTIADRAVPTRREIAVAAGLALLGLGLLVGMTMFSPPETLQRLHGPLAAWLPARAVEIVLNVALFVPLGAAVGLVARARWLWAVVALSVAVELLQLGLPDRQTELIDVVSNSTGAALGFAIARRLRHPQPRRDR
jgi:glycopeptide antibiotics resistance protein